MGSFRFCCSCDWVWRLRYRGLDARDLFYRQSGAHFYRTMSYVLSSSVSLVPLAFVETLVLGPLMALLCGFVLLSNTDMLGKSSVLGAVLLLRVDLAEPSRVERPVMIRAVRGFCHGQEQMSGWLVRGYRSVV